MLEENGGNSLLGGATQCPGISFNMIAVCGSMMTGMEQRDRGAFNGVSKMALLLTKCAIIYKYDTSSHVVNTM